METGVLFIALDKAKNCLAVTPGMWDGITINESGLIACHSRNVGRKIRTRKEKKHEIKQVKRASEKRGDQSRGV